MAALEATIHVRGTKGERSIPIADFHLLPGNTPERETVLEPGDLITHVTLPPPALGSRSLYLKLRDRASYEFALVSAAVVVTVANGKISCARIASVAWALSRGQLKPKRTDRPICHPEIFRRAADAACVSETPEARTGSKWSWPGGVWCTR
jgi:xanthine dehydrogenase YagS FAD-binding subunit